MSVLDDVQAAVAVHGLSLRRAWPRDPGHLLIDLVPADPGPPVAGQWFTDHDRAREVAVATGAPGRAHGGLVLQPDGADRRLPGLAPLLRSPAASLVAHRPERRAVVRRADGSYTKVVRPGRTGPVAAAGRAAGRTGLRVPAILEIDDAAGYVTTGPLAGRTLHDLLVEGSWACVPAAREAGRALARLHASPLPPDAKAHDARAELSVLLRWWGDALCCDVLPRGARLPELDALGEKTPCGLVPVHRDLHDKQLVVDGHGEVGFLDFDLAAAGEPALDLANLLVHLELRAYQGAAPADLASRCAQAVLDGYDPPTSVLARLDVHAQATRLRLIAVCAFRPDERVDAGFATHPSRLIRTPGG